VLHTTFRQRISPPLQALLLDRDGTLNVERADYVRTPAELVLLPGVLQAMARIATWQVPVLVVTNQSCVGRGLVTREMLSTIHDRLCEEVEAAGGRIDAFFVCPHRPDEGCGCRKPAPGLLLQAAAAFGLDLRRCVFVGDSDADLLAGDAANCPAIFVGTGRQGPLPGPGIAHSDLPVVRDLSAALDLLEPLIALTSAPTAALTSAPMTAKE